MMIKPSKSYSEKAVIALLHRYSCPVPFHSVRTLFLGNVASPGLDTQPMEVVKSLWGGELPACDGMDELNHLIEMLIMGLWNDLTRHQKRSHPFRLWRPAIGETREDLAELTGIRREEIDAFAQGLLDFDTEMKLPTHAHEAMTVLADMGQLLDSILELVSDASKPTSPTDVAETFKNLRELTKIAEREMHAAVLDCTRERRDVMRVIGSDRGPMH